MKIFQMRRSWLLPFFYAMALAACNTSQPLQTSILVSQQSLDTDAPIAVLQPYDTTIISSEYLVGHIKTPPRGKKAQLRDFHSILHSYQDIAQKNGANIIFLNHVQYAASLKEHDYIEATLYRVPDVRAYEKKIFWSAKRKLAWEDFKAAIPDSFSTDVDYSSYASLGIQHRSNAAFLVGTDRFFVLSSFDCDKSWYRPYAYFQNHYLEFQQGLFDLTELYARKMRQHFTDKKLKVQNKALFIQQTDQEISQEYKQAESQYVLETKGGSDVTALKSWHDKIWNDLKDY